MKQRLGEGMPTSERTESKQGTDDRHAGDPTGGGDDFGKDAAGKNDDGDHASPVRDSRPMSAGNPGRDAVVECRGVRKVFRDFWLRPRVTAVDGLDLTVQRGEVFGLLGPNGSGKSTTIKMLLGLLFPSDGEISVLGGRPGSKEVLARVGYLPEDSYLYPFLDGRETLEYFARLFGLDATERRRRASELLEMVGLPDAGLRPVQEYSKGMQRRIGLAQSLINDPELLILDEPTNGLDPIGTRQVKDVIHALRERGKTVIVTSHLLADVEEVSDRVSILYGGKQRLLGTVAELLADTGRTVIETDRLPPELVGEFQKRLEEAGIPLHRVDAPRQHLEALFLDIVRSARSEGAVTSGARETGAIAPFIGSSHGAESGEETPRS